MNGRQIDELLKRKVDNARRGRTTRTVIAVLALVALIAVIAAAVHHHKAKAVSNPDAPSTVETDTEPSPEQTDAQPSQAMNGQKPLQPEQMRRQQNWHELMLVWSGVPEEEIPPIVTLTMLCEGKEVARFTLSGESEWRHSWADDYPSESLSLRADLPKSIMASFVLRGDEFTVTGAYAVAPPADAQDGEAGNGESAEDAETEDGETAEAGDGETAEDAETGDGETSAQAESSDGEQPENRSDEPAGDAPEDAEEAEDADGESPAAPGSGHNWWPIVLLMICGAVLVTLGLFGTDRRRTR